MELFMDRESLKDINKELEQEIDNLKQNIDSYYKEIETMSNWWKGDRYNILINEINNNKENITNMDRTLKQYTDLIQLSVDSYTNIEEGIRYNES